MTKYLPPTWLNGAPKDVQDGLELEKMMPHPALKSTAVSQLVVTVVLQKNEFGKLYLANHAREGWNTPSLW